jgi:hypothetical protein
MKFFLVMPLLMVSLVFPGHQVWAKTGTISGAVSDETGALLPGARVSLINSDSGLMRTMVSDREGQYQFPLLAPGDYELAAELTGFCKEILRGISLAVGQQAVINLNLKVGEMKEEIIVTSEAPLVNVTTEEISGLVDEKRIEELPLNGRDWIQLAELNAGVVKARSVGFSSTGNMPAGRISINGQRPNATNFVLDGTDINVYSQTRPPGSVSQGMVLGVEAIREFRIVTSNYSAEFGAKSGGLVDVVSRSGTNAFHGSIYWFHRNDNLDAKNFFNPAPAPEFRRHQYGLSAGGPIRKNHTFLFANYEVLTEIKGVTSSGVVMNSDARKGFLPNAQTRELQFIGVNPDIKPFLELYPLPNGPDFGNGTALWVGSEMRSTLERFFTLRIDHQISNMDSIFGRYTFDNGKAVVPFGGASSPFPGFGQSNSGRDQVLTIEETRIVSERTLNTLRFGMNRRARLAVPIDPNPKGLGFSLIPNAALGLINVGGLGAVGNTTRPLADLVQNTYHITDTLSFIIGKQSFRFGVDIRRFQLNDTLELETDGSIAFDSLRGFLQNQPTIYKGALPGADFPHGLRFAQYAFYFQDSIRVTPKLSLNVGLRYEPWSNVSEVNGKIPILLNPLQASGPESYRVVEHLFTKNFSKFNLSPRFGFAWDPIGDAKTSIRGGFGIYYDSPLNGDLIDIVITAPPFVNRVEVRNPGFPDILETPSGVGNPQLSPTILEYNNLNWPYVAQYSLSVQRRFLQNLVLTSAYSGARGFHLVSKRGLNSNIPDTLSDGTKFFPVNALKKNPLLGSIDLRATDAKSWYDSLQVTADKRFSIGFSLLGSYTFSKLLDESSTGIENLETSGQPKCRMDSDNLRIEKGLGAFDVRHNFAASFLWDLPLGHTNVIKGNHSSLADKFLSNWQLNGILTFASGNPFTPLISFNRSRSGVSNSSLFRVDRPNLKPGFSNNPRIGRPDLWYDPNAFELPPAGFFGNLGRNTVIGPGYANVDFSATKSIALEGVASNLRIEFKAEFLNILNHPNFDLPGNTATVSSASFIFTDTSGEANPAAAQLLRTTNDAREIQFALKVKW